MPDTPAPDAPITIKNHQITLNEPISVASKLGDERSGANCPHEKIIAAYKKILPGLPPVKSWNDARQKMLNARWRWVLTQKDDDGKKLAKNEQDALEYFERLFVYIRDCCPFLMGKSGRGWQANLPWIIKEANWQKVIEGQYEQEAAA
jgi:hypothetical protein